MKVVRKRFIVRLKGHETIEVYARSKAQAIRNSQKEYPNRVIKSSIYQSSKPAITPDTDNLILTSDELGFIEKERKYASLIHAADNFSEIKCNKETGRISIVEYHDNVLAAIVSKRNNEQFSDDIKMLHAIAYSKKEAYEEAKRILIDSLFYLNKVDEGVLSESNSELFFNLAKAAALMVAKAKMNEYMKPHASGDDILRRNFLVKVINFIKERNYDNYK